MKPKTTKNAVPPQRHRDVVSLRGQRRNPESGIRNLEFRIPLYPYQERWVRDRSRFKIAVKATQIGYSFAAALEAVLDSIAHRALWIVLSRGERQSLEFMQKVREHAQALRIVGGKLETSFFDQADILQHEVKFPNGSRIIGLPANPDTARGYTGNLILDEFAFHQHDREIWAAAFGRVSRGDLKLRVLSTPNGQRGKYYELAKEAGLTAVTSDEWQVTSKNIAESPSRHSSLVTHHSLWSGHWCDVHTAVAQGCPMDVAALRRAIGDEQTWRQEYECVFLAGRENYLPLDLILACQSPEASASFPVIPSGAKGEARDLHFGIRDSELPIRDSGFRIPNRALYFGYDVGRVRDLGVLAVVERRDDVFWTRALIEMPGATFSAQEQVLRDVIPHCVRGAVDATGLGMEMAERLAAQFPGKVEPVTFTLARKQDLAIRLKRCFEERSIRIPDRPELRRDLNAVQRIVTDAGNIRFDAERDAEHGHADRFWALALALSAADRRSIPVASGGIDSEQDWYAPTARMENSKSQILNPKQTQNPNFQIVRPGVAWNLEREMNLGLGAWDLEFPSERGMLWA